MRWFGKRKASSQVSPPPEPDYLLSLRTEIDRLKTYVDTLDDQRRRINRTERMVYRKNGDNADNGSDDQGDMSWVAGVK